VVLPGEEKAPGRPYNSLPVYKGGLEERLFTKACRDRTRGNGFKLKEGRFILDMREKLFMMRGVGCWIWLPREAVNAPSHWSCSRL